MKRLTRDDINLEKLNEEDVDMPTYKSLYDKVRKYEKLEDNCVRTHFVGLEMLLNCGKNP